MTKKGFIENAKVNWMDGDTACSSKRSTKSGKRYLLSLICLDDETHYYRSKMMGGKKGHLSPPIRNISRYSMKKRRYMIVSGLIIALLATTILFNAIQSKFEVRMSNSSPEAYMGPAAYILSKPGHRDDYFSPLSTFIDQSTTQYATEHPFQRNVVLTSNWTIVVVYNTGPEIVLKKSYDGNSWIDVGTLWSGGSSGWRHQHSVDIDDNDNLCIVTGNTYGGGYGPTYFKRCLYNESSKNWDIPSGKGVDVTGADDTVAPTCITVKNGSKVDIYVAFEYCSGTSYNASIYKSYDNGSSFHLDARLGVATSQYCWFNCLTRYDNSGVALITRIRPDNKYYWSIKNNTADVGNWSPFKFSFNAGSQWDYHSATNIGNKIYMAWADSGSNGMKFTTFNGSTWSWTSSTKINSPIALGGHCNDPTVSTDGTNIHIVYVTSKSYSWVGPAGNETYIVYRRYYPNNDTWYPDLSLNETVLYSDGSTPPSFNDVPTHNRYVNSPHRCWTEDHFIWTENTASPYDVMYGDVATGIPEFWTILVPIAGSIILFAVMRQRYIGKRNF